MPVLIMLFSLTALQISMFAPTRAHAAVSDWQKGLTLRLTNEPRQEVSASLEKMVEVGADHVTITPGYLTDNTTSSNVERKYRTPSDDILIYTIDRAHELGLKVFLKPHLDLKTNVWRAKLDPTDKVTFFKNYNSMMMNYARISQEHNVELLSVGAELYKLSTNPANDGYWRSLVKDIRGVYKGKLTYSGNALKPYFDESSLTFWDALDYWGLSIYIPLSSGNNPNQQEIAQKWAQAESGYILPMAKKIGKPVLITEIGFRSIDGAAVNPEDYEVDAPVDLQEQAELYKGTLEFWKDKDYLQGMHLWDWKVGVNAGGSNDKDYTPQNKPAQEILKSYFKGTSVSKPTVPVPAPQNPEPQDPSTPAPPTGETKKIVSKLKSASKRGNYGIGAAEKTSKLFMDRNYMITGIPSELENKELIRTRNSDKYETKADILSFELVSEANIYIAYDSRASKTPAWMNGYIKTGKTVQTTDVPYSLYVKKVAAGKHVLGGNYISSKQKAASNYFVIIEPIVQQTETTTETTQTSTYQTDGLKYKMIVVSPENYATVTGEKKLQFYIPGLPLEEYTAVYSADDDAEVEVKDASDLPYKEETLDFTNWTWNGSGPYKIVARAKDLSGNVIAESTVLIYTRSQ